MSLFHAQRATKRYARQIALFRQRIAACPNSARSTLSDRGWQQPLDHHKAQPARRVKDAEGTAQPLVLDSVRWLGYSATHISNAPPYPTPSRPCSSSLECISSGTIRRPKWILRQFKKETRRLSSAKSSLVTQKWHSTTRNCVLRNFEARSRHLQRAVSRMPQARQSRAKAFT